MNIMFILVILILIMFIIAGCVNAYDQRKNRKQAIKIFLYFMILAIPAIILLFIFQFLGNFV